MNLIARNSFATAFAAVFGAATLCAEIELTPNFSLSGYLSGSVSYFDQDGSDTSMTLDQSKLQADLKFSPVSATFSYYYVGDSDAELLDAYITGDLGGGATLSAGKFLSYHGYEAFDAPNMLQISYANDYAAIIPGYHKGVKLDLTSGASSFGIAALDSVYGSDSDLDNGMGFEAYYKFSTENTAVYLGAAYESSKADLDSEIIYDTDSYLLDLWVEQGFGAITLAGEIAYGSTDYGDDDVDSYFALLLAKFDVTPKDVLVGRVSTGEEDYDDYKAKFAKGTVAYTHSFSDNFALVSELSCTDFNDADNATFLGVQGIFTF